MVAELVPGTTRQGVLLDAMHLDAAKGMAPYPSGSQIVRLAAAVIHGCHPLLPGRGRLGKAMLYIDSGPPKSVDRTYFFMSASQYRHRTAWSISRQQSCFRRQASG